jgi:hypothetical protein
MLVVHTTKREICTNNWTTSTKRNADFSQAVELERNELHS